MQTSETKKQEITYLEHLRLIRLKVERENARKGIDSDEEVSKDEGSKVIEHEYCLIWTKNTIKSILKIKAWSLNCKNIYSDSYKSQEGFHFNQRDISPWTYS